MVSIKSLAVLLFAAAVTAAPLVGNEHHDGHNVKVNDSSKTCPGQNQKLYCCDDADKIGNVGTYTSVLDNIKVKCNSGISNVQSVDGVSNLGQCSAKAACCSSSSKQNGLGNSNIDCVAFTGN
ncbi:hypothetical protein HOY82DRAFT_618174 [Tuber indicum]|nr:hypothetical protein HOY82DRAFT_618174 [Tuber indicum]